MSAPSLKKAEVGDKPTSFAYRLIRFGVWLFSPKWKLSGAEKLPEGAMDALREFTDCLNQWATDERLLERRSEARGPKLREE